MSNEVKPNKFSRRKIDFTRIGNKTLVLLNQRYLESKEFYVSFNEIVIAIPGEPKNAIWDELRNLIGQKKVSQKTETKASNPFSNLIGGQSKTETYEVLVDGYTITRTGIAEVNKFTDEAYEVLFAELVIKTPAQLETEGEKWTPLPIDRESTEFNKAVEATELALKEIEGSNGFADTEPLQRNSIVETIKSNLKNLKEGLISKGQILEGMIKPLRAAAAIFTNASIGELARRAANFLWTLIAGS